jgi:hypothetical protein
MSNSTSDDHPASNSTTTRRPQLITKLPVLLDESRTANNGSLVGSGKDAFHDGTDNRTEAPSSLASSATNFTSPLASNITLADYYEYYDEDVDEDPSPATRSANVTEGQRRAGFEKVVFEKDYDALAENVEDAHEKKHLTYGYAPHHSHDDEEGHYHGHEDDADKFQFGPTAYGEYGPKPAEPTVDERPRNEFDLPIGDYYAFGHSYVPFSRTGDVFGVFGEFGVLIMGNIPIGTEVNSG